MSDSTAMKLLAEQVSAICSEYHRLLRRCTSLERKIDKLSGGRQTDQEPAAPARRAKSGGGKAGRQFDNELVRSKVEEMLAELADIG